MLDSVHVHALPCQQQTENLPLLLQFGAGFQHRQNILFPVHLAHEQDHRIIPQREPAGDFLHVRRTDGAHRCTVGHHLNLAFIAVALQHVRGVAPDGPHLVAAVVEIHDEFGQHPGHGLGLRGLQEIVVVFGMKSSHQRKLANRGQAQGLGPCVERTVGMHNIQLHHPDPLAVMGVEHRLAEAVLFQPGHGGSHKVQQLIRKPAPGARVIHRRDHCDLVPHGRQGFRIGLHHTAHPVNHRQKGIAKLSDLQHD